MEGGILNLKTPTKKKKTKQPLRIVVILRPSHMSCTQDGSKVGLLSKSCDFIKNWSALKVYGIKVNGV